LKLFEQSNWRILNYRMNLKYPAMNPQAMNNRQQTTIIYILPLILKLWTIGNKQLLYISCHWSSSYEQSATNNYYIYPAMDPQAMNSRQQTTIIYISCHESSSYERLAASNYYIYPTMDPQAINSRQQTTIIYILPWIF
jgi:hypothetical protein